MPDNQNSIEKWCVPYDGYYNLSLEINGEVIKSKVVEMKKGECAVDKMNSIEKKWICNKCEGEPCILSAKGSFPAEPVWCPFGEYPEPGKEEQMGAEWSEERRKKDRRW
jgi:hypothetical protein